MVRYHIATGDGKAYYGVNYESYREAKAVLEFSQKRDPQAHIVEEEYHFTNADRIRAMSDENLAEWINDTGVICNLCAYQKECEVPCGRETCIEGIAKWLQQPAEECTL